MGQYASGLTLCAYPKRRKQIFVKGSAAGTDYLVNLEVPHRKPTMI